MNGPFGGKTIRVIFGWVIFGISVFTALLDLFMPIAGYRSVWSLFGRWGNGFIGFMAMLLILILIALSIFSLFAALKPFHSMFCMLTFIFCDITAGWTLLLMVITAASDWSLGSGLILTFIDAIAILVLGILLFIGMVQNKHQFGTVRIGRIDVVCGSQSVTYELSPNEEYRVGRYTTNSIVMNYQGISGQHLRIMYQPSSNNYVVMDNNSSCGTFMANGAKLDARRNVRIMGGTRLWIGNSHRAYIYFN